MQISANVDSLSVVDKSVIFNNSSSLPNVSFAAIVLAMHDLEKENLYAILADINERAPLRTKWKVDVTRIGPELKNGQKIYFCVPLKKREEKDDNHLRLDVNELT